MAHTITRLLMLLAVVAMFINDASAQGRSDLYIVTRGTFAAKDGEPYSRIGYLPLGSVVTMLAAKPAAITKADRSILSRKILTEGDTAAWIEADAIRQLTSADWMLAPQVVFKAAKTDGTMIEIGPRQGLRMILQRNVAGYTVDCSDIKGPQCVVTNDDLKRGYARVIRGADRVMAPRVPATAHGFLDSLRDWFPDIAGDLVGKVAQQVMDKLNDCGMAIAFDASGGLKLGVSVAELKAGITLKATIKEASQIIETFKSSAPSGTVLNIKKYVRCAGNRPTYAEDAFVRVRRAGQDSQPLLLTRTVLKRELNQSAVTAWFFAEDSQYPGSEEPRALARIACGIDYYHLNRIVSRLLQGASDNGIIDLEGNDLAFVTEQVTWKVASFLRPSDDSVTCTN